MEFPGLGEHCSRESCNRLDFLPVKCDSCLKIFCNAHFRYDQHACDGEGGRRGDAQVPTCPLCGTPVPGKRGEPPDVAVSAHIDDDCQEDRAKKRRNKIFTNRCSFKGCKVKELVPVVCPECALNHCFKHRHAADHNCEGKISAVRQRSEQAALNRIKEKDAFNIVQGDMSEDEALARALARSMEDQVSTPGTSTGRPVSEPNGKCQIS